jgi:UDP-N-acetylglucosamine diphosphorylase/glucosamine-1-phosphate N-acetyltransferase
MHVVIFEGSHWRTFAPFSLSRPVFGLACGMGTLLAKQIRATSPTRVTLWVRPALEDYCRRVVIPQLPCPGDVNTPLDDEPALLISGRTLHLTQLEHSDDEFVVVEETASGPIVRQALVHSPGLNADDILRRTDRWLRLLDLPRSMPQSRLPDYIWQLLGWNEDAIVTDFIEQPEPSQPKPSGHYHVVDDANIWLGRDVVLSPGCVLDGSKGPVIVAENAAIGANAVLEGPCYVGPNSTISPLAYIRTGTSIGPWCKIGGEISNSILQGYVNKPHEGFLGDSYVGEWVNLGAGTTTSNLKNTYGEINMQVDGCTVKTGRQFLGAFIGDHTKTAIGTRLMTGSYIGYSCMIATSQYTPRIVPSFTFLTDEGAQPYRMDKAAEMMKSVFNRRQRDWTAADEQVNQYVAQTAPAVEK